MRSNCIQLLLSSALPTGPSQLINEHAHRTTSREMLFERCPTDHVYPLVDRPERPGYKINLRDVSAWRTTTMTVCRHKRSVQQDVPL